MAISGGIRIEGLNKVVRDMQKLGVEVDDLKGAFSAISTEGARLATSFIRSRTGRLAATVRGSKTKNKAILTAGRAKTSYAGPQNYGWPGRNIAPQHFMQKAEKALEPRLVPMLEEGLDEAIRKAGLR